MGKDYVKNIKEEEDGVILETECPLCSNIIEQELEIPKREYQRTTCYNCENKYYTYPIVDEEGNKIEKMNLSLKEEINIQFNSVEKAYEITKRHPSGTAQASYTAIQGISAMLATTTGYIGVALISVGATQLIQSSIIFKSLFYIIPIILFLGVAGTVLGPGASLYEGYKVYLKESPEYSYSKFIYHIANNYQTKPNE